MKDDVKTNAMKTEVRGRRVELCCAARRYSCFVDISGGVMALLSLLLLLVGIIALIIYLT